MHLTWQQWASPLPRFVVPGAGGQLADQVFARRQAEFPRDAAGEAIRGAAFAPRLGLRLTSSVLADPPTGGGVTNVFSGCRAFGSASLTIPNNAETDVLLDSERWDTNAYHSTAVNTERLTAPATDYYEIGGSVCWDTSALGSRLLGVRLNGTGNYLVIEHRDATSGGLQTRMFVHTQYHLLAGEYVTLTCYQDSGGNRTITREFLSSPEFYINRLP